MLKTELTHQGHRLLYFLKKAKPFSGRAILFKLAGYLIGNPAEKMIVKTLHGFKILIDPVNDNGVERSIFETGTYELGTLKIFESVLKKGDTVIDVGANIGLMSLFTSHKVGRTGKVHAFEPNAATFKMLAYNCDINHIENIRLNEFGLGSEKTTGFLADNMHINRGAASLINGSATNGNLVQIDTLDSYVKDNNINEIGLIKVDVEGFEWEMLKGARSTFLKIKPKLCMEFSATILSNNDAIAIYEFLKTTIGYRIFKPEHWKGDIGPLVEVKDFTELPVHDNIFCFTPAHLTVLDKGLFNEK